MNRWKVILLITALELIFLAISILGIWYSIRVFNEGNIFVGIIISLSTTPFPILFLGFPFYFLRGGFGERAKKRRHIKGMYSHTLKNSEPSEEVERNALRRYERFRDACLYEAVSKCFRRVEQGNELPLSRILRSVRGRANTCFNRKMKSLYQGMLNPEEYFEEIFSEEEIVKTIHFVLAHKRINGTYDEDKKVFRKHTEED